ncbi:MAG: hypothetical protein ACREBU_10795 [Nitrososphaera sp.]
MKSNTDQAALEGAPQRKASVPQKAAARHAVGGTSPDVSHKAISPVMESIGIKAFEHYIQGVSVYLEYGSGGSTVLAARNGVKDIISVDSDLGWLDAVKRESAGTRSNVHLVHCDVGPTKEWGMPTDKSLAERFHRYPIAPWDAAEKLAAIPQMIFIDGRFRVACFLYSLLQGRVETPILFDDYRERSYYHVVEEFCDVQQMHGRMAEFAVTKNYSHKRLTAAIMKYSVDPG